MARTRMQVSGSISGIAVMRRQAFLRRWVLLLAIVSLLVSGVPTAFSSGSNVDISAMDILSLPAIQNPLPDANGWRPPTTLPAKGKRPSLKLVRWDPTSHTVTYVPEVLVIPAQEGEPLFLGYHTGRTMISERATPWENIRKTPGYLGDGEDPYPPNWMNQHNITVHLYTSLNDTGYANWEGSGAYLTWGTSRVPNQYWETIHCVNDPFGGCQNAWGESVPWIEMWGNITPPSEGDKNTRLIRVNHDFYQLPAPIVVDVNDGEPFIPYDATFFRQINVPSRDGRTFEEPALYQGDRSNYVVFLRKNRRGDYTRSVSIRVPSSEPPVIVVPETGILFNLEARGSSETFEENGQTYLPLRPLFNLLGTTLTPSLGTDRIWDVTIPPEDVFENHWTDGCALHGYGQDALPECSGDLGFLFVLAYTNVEQGFMGPQWRDLPNREEAVLRFVSRYSSAIEWLDKDLRSQEVAWLNHEVIRWSQADYEVWTKIALDYGEFGAHLIASIAAGKVLDGVTEKLMTWHPRPWVMHRTAAQTTKVASGMKAKNSDLIKAIETAGLNKGLPVRGVAENAPAYGSAVYIRHAPRGSAERTQYINQARWANMPAPVEVPGHPDFIAVWEQALIPGQGANERIGRLLSDPKGLVRIAELKQGYRSYFWDDNPSGDVKPFLQTSWEELFTKQLRGDIARAKQFASKGVDQRVISAWTDRAVMQRAMADAQKFLTAEEFEMIDWVHVQDVTQPFFVKFQDWDPLR